MRKRKEILTIALGIIAAVVILAGQVNYHNVQAKAIEKVVTQDTEDEKDEEVKIFTNFAVSSAVNFNLNQILHFITDIYSEAVERVQVYIEETLNPTDYFEVLFQRIISPNAP